MGAAPCVDRGMLVGEDGLKPPRPCVLLVMGVDGWALFGAKSPHGDNLPREVIATLWGGVASR